MSQNQHTPPESSGPAATPNSVAISDMLQQGLLQEVNAGDIDSFLAGQGLHVLFFAGSNSRKSDAHDVAVALREVLKDYRDEVAAALVTRDEAELQPRFRVSVLPTLVLVVGGEILEILPRVRDWADYVQAFQRYLGAPQRGPSVELSS
jgi:hydrogenase-1 operon protein HyaE